jgi:hypothetical protein
VATKRSPALVTKPARPPDATCSNVFTVTPGKTRLDVARLPICESHVAMLWRKWVANPPYSEGNLEAFVARYDLFGKVARELWEWNKAGCPHVCLR